MNDTSSADLKSANKGHFKNIIAFFAIAASTATIISCYVLFTQWWSNRTQLEIYPSSIRLDSLGVIGYLFALDSTDLDIINEANNLDTVHCFDYSLGMMQISGITNSGKSGLIGKCNLNAIDVAIALLQKEMDNISSIYRIKLAYGWPKSDSIRFYIDKHKIMIDKLREIRKRKLLESAKQTKIVVETKIANLSNSQASIMEPCLLSLRMPDGPQMDVQLKLYGYSSQIQLFGMEMHAGPPVSVISGRSISNVNFCTLTAGELGDTEWTKLEEALAKSQFKAKIVFIASDDTQIESKEFPFSSKFASQRSDELLKDLKK
ncbi:hypothetical protein TRIP_C80045 [Candidatus Zixiibacteriota bacterium]|nr:hypothetical protein TRIP_C80045 [candidate division Zixibacteria bacterium]